MGERPSASPWCRDRYERVAGHLAFAGGAAAGIALALLYLIQARWLGPRTEFDSAGYWIIGALLGAALLTLQLVVVYIPLLQGIFKRVALPAADLAISKLMSSVVFWGIELQKRLFPSQ